MYCARGAGHARTQREGQRTKGGGAALWRAERQRRQRRRRAGLFTTAAAVLQSIRESALRPPALSLSLSVSLSLSLSSISLWPHYSEWTVSAMSVCAWGVSSLQSVEILSHFATAAELFLTVAGTVSYTAI
jgi:hypothetical protein